MMRGTKVHCDIQANHQTIQDVDYDKLIQVDKKRVLYLLEIGDQGGFTNSCLRDGSIGLPHRQRLTRVSAPYDAFISE